MYNSVDNILTVYIQSGGGGTNATAVINEINSGANSATIPFTADVYLGAGDNDGSGTFGLTNYNNVTSGGTAGNDNTGTYAFNAALNTEFELSNPGTGVIHTALVTSFGGADSVPIDVGGLSVGEGTRLELNNTVDLASLADGFAQIIIGGSLVNEGPVQIGTSDFKDPVTILGTEIIVSGTVSVAGSNYSDLSLVARTGRIEINSGGSLTASNAGADVNLLAATDILLPDGSISADDEVNLTATTGQIDQAEGVGQVGGTTVNATAPLDIDLNTAADSITASSTTADHSIETMKPMT